MSNARYAPNSGRKKADSGNRTRVGPARSVSGGTVVAINQAVVDKPEIANKDPYEAGWLVVIEPDDWDTVKGSLTPGTEVAPAYEAKMAADGFDGCG